MITTMGRALLILALVILDLTGARASELLVSYEALERNIVVQLMTQDGRYYMQGDPSTPCAYAFVQDPRVDAYEGRLRIRLLFSGSAATSIRGQCIGAGDNFDLAITGVPKYANGELYLDQMSVQATAAYFRGFCCNFGPATSGWTVFDNDWTGSPIMPSDNPFKWRQLNQDSSSCVCGGTCGMP